MMARIAAFFVAICMVLIAAAVGALLYLSFGLGGTESALVALACLSALALYNSASTRVHRTDVGGQIADLSRGTTDLARQVAELGRRVTVMEGKVEKAGEIARAAADPLAAEIGELGSLMTQLAESVAAHDLALAGRHAAPGSRGPASAPGLAVEGPAGADEAELAAPPGRAVRTGTVPLDDISDDGVVALVRDAVDAGRVDLYLQPIVTLPQRKVRYYEALTRLRTAEGDVVAAADFLPQAEAAGLMPKIDNLLLFRCVQVVRRLTLKNRDVGLFCNLSPSTLADSATFPQILEFIEANRALAPSLVFEFTQAALRNMGPIEQESLAALADRGFRFSMDTTLDLRIEPRDLAERGIRFVKIPSGLLLNRAGSAAADIHPADLSDLLGRFGIDMIADRIESEGAVVDLLDYEVRFGQGFLFSPPRPVRAEALQAVADRPEPPAREAPAAAPRQGGEQRGNIALARGIARRV